MCRKIELDNSLTLYTKINQNGVAQETTKILQNTDSNLFDLSHSNFLLDTSLEVRETKEKMNYWDFIRIKSFCTEKKAINKTKRQPMEWEKIFANDISDKGLVSKIHKELIKLNSKETNLKKKQTIMKWAKDMNRNFTTE